MLTDEVSISVTAGKGGDGVVAFDKIKMSLGPTGGDGGKGGDIYLEGVSNLSALNKYRHKREHFAENGQNGKGDKSTGAGGKDLVLTVPIGSFVTISESGRSIDIRTPGEKVLIARGGKGGRGNFCFRSPSNTTPKEREEGKLGECFGLSIELRLIADIGLIGLPSAGKSSLLNELTAAEAKVGAYHFTTLEPNLGVMDGIIIADIPGLIEGASDGRGLGTKFLRHIRRTKILAHCISLESEDPEKDYLAVRKELEKFDPELAEKKEIILLTKSDIATPETATEKARIFGRYGREIMTVSIHDLDSILHLGSNLRKLV